MPRGQRFAPVMENPSTDHARDQSSKPGKTAVVLAAVALTLAGCGGQPRLAVPDTPTPLASQTATGPTQMPATPVNRDPEIGNVVWTAAVIPDANTPIDPVTTFEPDTPSIIASVPVRNLPRGASIDAAWSYNDTPLEAFAIRIVAEESSEERWLSFRLDRDPAFSWPTGTYAISISLDGRQIQQASIEVTESESIG